MDFRSKKQDAENKVEKTKKLLGKTFYSLPENSWEVKQDLSKSSGVIYDYIYAQFCRTHKDRKIVNMYELIKTLKYTFNTIMDSIKQLIEKGIFLIRKLSSGSFLFLIPDKEESIEYVKRFDEGKMVISNVTYINDIEEQKSSETLFQKSVRKVQNIGKKLIKTEMKLMENEIELIEIDKVIPENCKVSIDETIDKTELEPSEKTLLDLYSLDPIYIDHSSLEKEEKENIVSRIEVQEPSLNLPVVENDDDLSEVFKIQEKEVLVKSESVVIPSVENIEITTITPGPKKEVISAITENQDLLDLFNSISYNENQALELIKTKSREFILEAFQKLNCNENINSKAGWLYSYFKNPQNYKLTGKDLKVNKETQEKEDLSKLYEIFGTDKKDGEVGIAEKLNLMVTEWKKAGQAKLFQESRDLLIKFDDLVAAAKKYNSFKSVVRFFSFEVKEMIGVV